MGFDAIPLNRPFITKVVDQVSGRIAMGQVMPRHPVVCTESRPIKVVWPLLLSYWWKLDSVLFYERPENGDPRLREGRVVPFRSKPSFVPIIVLA